MARKPLVRPRRGQGRWVAGVCRGLADSLGVGVGLVRLVFVVFGLFGPGEVAYVVLWVLMPKTKDRFS